MAEKQQHKRGTDHLCDVCHSVQSRYCCPACNRRTCSLTCVNAHKADTGCTGKPSVTAYKSLKKFTDTDLVKDIRFLEEGSLLVDVAGRLASPHGQNTNKSISVKSKNPNQNRKRQRKERSLPFRLQEIVTQAKARGVDVEMMPAGMSRRQQNKTYYHRRERELSWTIALQFEALEDAVEVVLPSVSEKKVLGDIVREFLHGPDKEQAATRARLHAFRKALDEGKRVVVSFVSESLTDGKDVRIVDEKCLLSEALMGGSVIEYPIFKVSISHAKGS